MKKILVFSFLLGLTYCLQSQNISRRAKADRLLQIADKNMKVKEVKIQSDTLLVVSLVEDLFYPFGKYTSVDNFVHKSNIEWYRSSNRHEFHDSLDITVYNFARLDDSYFDFFHSVNTGLLEYIDGIITDKNLVFQGGVRVGMTKQALLKKYFKNPPLAYIDDIKVLKVCSGLYEVAQTFTFDEDQVICISFSSTYMYY